MKKRNSELIPCFMIFLGVLGILTNYTALGNTVLFIWYILFGFVTLGHTMLLKDKLGLSNLFLTVTLPYFLLPYRKAYYYLSKSMRPFQSRTIPTPLLFASLQAFCCLPKETRD